MASTIQSSNSKICSKCKEIKPLDEFYVSKDKKSGRSSYCKECSRQRHAEWQKSNPKRSYANQIRWKKSHPEETRRIGREGWRRLRAKDPEKWRRYERERTCSRYGKTAEWFKQQSEKQNGLCMLCGKPPGIKGLAIDHCHKTLQVRGLLCTQCNTALHKMERDIEWIRKAEAYLQKHGAMG